MSEDSEAERKGSSAGEPSQFETRATLAAVCSRHSHLASMLQAGRAGSGSPSVNYV